MSTSSVANLISLSVPFSGNRNAACSKSPSSVSFRPVAAAAGDNSVRIRGGERIGNLDHLQKESKPQPAQPRRIAQVTAPIGLWDRYPTARTVQQMMDTMERLVEDPSYNSAALTRENGNRGYSRGRTPWDIIEGENGHKLRFDMPGLTKSDVKVWVEEKMLVVKGEKVVKKKEETEQGEAEGEAEPEEVWPANGYGKYSYRIALPEYVEYEKIKAEVKDGVLYITIPKPSTSNQVLDINVQ
ncbi:hypothetical protein MKW94_002234 [Papaver nudicaule]|uniref:SHSP domain-containing protein n=1 Tax=Papaver nudicaule TaxID=74823 RepID=A0AA41VJN5_PAPNU|nr:hypothetical protein [Papaver nudicaule]